MHLAADSPEPAVNDTIFYQTTGDSLRLLHSGKWVHSVTKKKKAGEPAESMQDYR
jgi:hypothetical protein